MSAVVREAAQWLPRRARAVTKPKVSIVPPVPTSVKADAVWDSAPKSKEANNASAIADSPENTARSTMQTKMCVAPDPISARVVALARPISPALASKVLLELTATSLTLRTST